MIEFLTYDLKVAALLAVFYMFYRLLLSRETFHRVNRVVLLLTAILSFVLPLCVFTIHKTVVVDLSKGNINFGGMEMMIEEAEPQTPFWQTAAVIVFFIGMMVTLGYTLQSILRVWLLIHHSEKHPQSDGTVICVAKGDVSPFSWMCYIVLSQSDYEAQNASILAHERGHIRQRHSLDVLLVDTLTVLQWFNPAMWMLRQDLRAIHEYEADAAVLSQGINMRQYQYLLIQKAVATCGYSVVNGISHSTLKNRITMMLTNKKTTSKSWLKVLALLPIAGVALVLNAETVNDYVYEQTPTKTQPQSKIVKKGKKNAQIKMGANSIEVKAEEVKTEGVTQQEQENKKILFSGTSSENDPLLVLDGKVATREQVMALSNDEIDHINVIMANEDNKDLRKVYGDKFNADTSNGITFICTKEYAKSDERKKDYVVVVKSKDKEDESEPLFDVVEQMPEFPGGQVEMMKFLSTNVKYPQEAMEKGIQGRVVVQFIIEKDGSITESKVVKKVNEHLDAEALRVVSEMPKWTPGKQRGKEVRVKYTLPVTFRLS